MTDWTLVAQWHTERALDCAQQKDWDGFDWHTLKTQEAEEAKYSTGYENPYTDRTDDWHEFC